MVIHGAPNPIELTNPILLILLMQILIVFFQQENVPSEKDSKSDSKASDHQFDTEVETTDTLNQSTEDVNKYEWGGQRLVGRDHKIFYTSLKISGAKGESIEIKTGNHITIENQDNRKQPFVAKVNKFYEDTKKETDKKRVLVEW